MAVALQRRTANRRSITRSRTGTNAVPIAGTIAERYLSETRGIDIGRLPAERIRKTLRFHPNCVFGQERLPCLLALMHDPIDDTPVGIQRIALAQ